jgi:hypothetical protein
MFPSIKHKKSTVYFLAWSLVVAGVIQSAIRPSDASHGVTSTQFTPLVKESVDKATKARVSEAYNKLPLSFEENHGQVDTQVKYLSRGSASTLFLTQTEAVLTLQASSMSVVRMKLQGANRSPSISGENEMSARTNYFIGNDPQQWHGDVAQYERVRYAEVYRGIDLLYYGQQQSLEYDFEVGPGADPRRIVLGFKGVRHLKIERATGDLLLETASGEIRQGKPMVYQEVDGERREVECRYVLKGKRKVGFQLGAYDQRKKLVIDPVLTYSTFLGGSGSDIAYAIAVDAVGNAYVTGTTESVTNFPVLNAYQTTGQDLENVFVTKLNTNLSGTAALLYSTYLGGSDYDRGYGIAIDSTGNAYVTGLTNSNNFPTLNQYQTNQNFTDVFVTKLNTNLSGTASLLYSTYLGGSNFETGHAIAVDSTGNAYVTGETGSTDFPILNQYQTLLGFNDVFVTRINTNLSGAASLIYSTYLGGTNGTDIGYGIAVDTVGIAYVTGFAQSSNFPLLNQYQTDQDYEDAFVTKIDTNSSGAASLVYSTYLGGNSTDYGYAIAIDSTGNAYVTGRTNSTNFPILNQYQTNPDSTYPNVFVTKLNTNISGTAALLYSTYLGGSSYDYGYAIAVDPSGNAYVTGKTESSNFPILNSTQTYQGGLSEVFVTKLNTNLSGAASLLYSTFLGGIREDVGNGIALDVVGNAYVTGNSSGSFPTTPNRFQTFQGGFQDAFIAKLTENHTPGDFDADGRADLALWHPVSGDWEYIRSLDGVLITQHWGASGDRPVPGHYDGDGRTDLAVYRPSQGNWYIFQSFLNSLKTVHWGESTDLPVAADYDGDGIADVALYRPSEGVWYIIQSSNNNALAIRWGISEDKPVPADYDRDGKADLAVYRPSESVWYILQSSDNSSRALQWGLGGDKPVVGDYDGDEKADVAVWRPSTGSWYVRRSSNGSLFGTQWGAQGDVPVPGDYDGDNRTDVAVWRPMTGAWYILRSSDGSLIQQQFGSSGDVPVPAAYLHE